VAYALRNSVIEILRWRTMKHVKKVACANILWSSNLHNFTTVLIECKQPSRVNNEDIVGNRHNLLWDWIRNIPSRWSWTQTPRSNEKILKVVISIYYIHLHFLYNSCLILLILWCDILIIKCSKHEFTFPFKKCSFWWSSDELLIREFTVVKFLHTQG
jgi:hypothetical protein